VSESSPRVMHQRFLHEITDRCDGRGGGWDDPTGLGLTVRSPSSMRRP